MRKQNRCLRHIPSFLALARSCEYSEQGRNEILPAGWLWVRCWFWIKKK